MDTLTQLKVILIDRGSNGQKCWIVQIQTKNYLNAVYALSHCPK